MQSNTTPIIIDIFLSVIDNYGDIGFATELLIAFEKEHPGRYHFRMFTDNFERVASFLVKNDDQLPTYVVFDVADSIKNQLSPLIFLLFHFQIPPILSGEIHTILRIDYLSFDADWVKYNEKEHILSTRIVPIIEIIPSFLPMGGGTLLPVEVVGDSRAKFLKELNLPIELEQKKWVSIFVYDETFKKLDFSHVDDDTIFFILGKSGETLSPCIYHLPFLRVSDYHALLSLSEVNLVRGEVSAVTATRIGKPFLWDMYKGQGGFPHAMSEQFLHFFPLSEQYCQIHRDYNLSQNPFDIGHNIRLLQQEQCFHSGTILHDAPSLLKTLEKYIDRFYFSL